MLLHDCNKHLMHLHEYNDTVPITSMNINSFCLCNFSARCCSRRAWSSRTTCRSCSSSSCWCMTCCAWASSCTDGHRAAVARSPCGAPEQQAAKPGATLQCSAVLGANRKLMMQMQSSSAAAPSKALLLSGSTKQVYLLFVCSASVVQ